MGKYTKNCELCDEKFETNREKQIYCKKPHPVICFICGEETE